MKKYIVRGDIPKDPALIIKDQLLLGPGVWNGKKFTAEQIKKGISLTDWTDIQRRAIVYGHRVDGDASPDEWLGYHSIPEYRQATKEDSEGMYADLYFYDENFSRKMAYGRAKAGVSERLEYSDKYDGVDILGFINLSVVNNPACKLAYLNLSDEGDVHTAEIMSPNYINLSDVMEGSMGTEIEEISNSNTEEREGNEKIIEEDAQKVEGIEALQSSEIKLDDINNYSTERGLSNAKTEKVEVVNTENLSDENTKQDMENTINNDSDKFKTLENKIAELEQKIQASQANEKAVSSQQTETVTKATNVTEPNMNNAVEITSSIQGPTASNKEVVEAIREMSNNVSKVITENAKVNSEIQRVANPQSVAGTIPGVDISSRDDDVVTKLVKQYEAMHNLDNE